MSKPQMIVRVRFQSNLSYDEVMEIVENRAPEFRALPGLIQKYYLYDAKADAFSGIYLWDGPESFAGYRDSELRATIGKAYQTKAEPHVEVYEVVKILRDDVESLRDDDGEILRDDD